MRNGVRGRVALLEDIRRLLSGGDRRSIADSNRVYAIIEADPSLVQELVRLTKDEDSLVVQRAIDLLEKLAQGHPDWIAPHKHVFIGPVAESDRWEIRLQVVRALPLFKWTPAQMQRVEAILLENVKFPQTFVQAWALDGLSLLSASRPGLRPSVRRRLAEFEPSPRKALQARARSIRAREGAARTSALWRCPKCRREFANENQSHACAGLHSLDITFAESSRDQAPVRSRARGGRGDRTGSCASGEDAYRIPGPHVVRANHAAPELARWARRPGEAPGSPRFRTVQTFSPRNHLHTFRIASDADIDDELRAWLAEAYGVGSQEHLEK